MAYVIGDDCIACGTCIGECPVEAISEGEKYSINPDLCTECGTCASVCPQEAISLGEQLGELHTVTAQQDTTKTHTTVVIFRKTDVTTVFVLYKSCLSMA